MIRPLVHAALVLCAVAFASSSVLAQATRTWVSGVGDDANPCSRTAPCKTFAGAISKTAAHGEISVLDPGGFGAVTITKSITIDGTGVVASILNAGINGVIVNAGPSDTVVLRNITINGVGTGINGIRFLAGSTLVIEGCVISGNTQKGIDLEPAAPAQVTVKDTSVRDSAGGAMFASPAGGMTLRVTVDNSRFERSLYGIRVNDDAKVTVNRSVASNNMNNGFLAASGGGGLAEINLEGSVASHNGTNGIATAGANSVIRISNSTITGNANGLNAAAGGQILSYGSNRIAGNSIANGVPTGPISEQ
jgi:hypothetical protein